MAQFMLNASTLSNINRFSKFFHCHNKEKICNNIITKDPTTPQVCRYTLPCEMSESHGFGWRVKNGEDWHRLRRARSQGLTANIAVSVLGDGLLPDIRARCQR